MKPTARLRDLLLTARQSRNILVIPGCHDALSARIAEQAGFTAVYMTGYGTSASMLGKPDVGLLSLTEMAQRAAHLAEAVGVPVLADADTGYGNALNVMRTVREYEKAGVAAIQLEDQVLPKKCGHMLGREIVSQEEMVGKIKAAADARRDADMVIIARTDARTTQGIDAALERGHAYEEAGADLLFIESPESVDEMRRITTSFRVPVLANMVEGGRTPFRPAAELQALGFQVALYCVSSTFAAAHAVRQMMAVLKETGTTAALRGQMIDFEEFNRLIGLPEYRQLEGKYIPGK